MTDLEERAVYEVAQDLAAAGINHDLHEQHKARLFSVVEAIAEERARGVVEFCHKCCGNPSCDPIAEIAKLEKVG